MAGSHRAERPTTTSGTPSRTILITVVVAVLPALYFGIHALASSGTSTGPKSSPPTRLPIPSATLTPTVTPTPTPTPTSTPAPPPLPRVKPDVPRRMSVAGVLDVGFNDAIQPRSGTFTITLAERVARWGSRGEPGSPGTDTVYVVGNVAGASSAFQHLGRLHTGSRIVIRTDVGLLTYTVGTVAQHRASGLTSDPAFRARKPGRLVLVGLEYTGSHRSRNVLLVTAQLSGARRR